MAATKSTLTHYGGDELQKQLARLTLALKEEKEHVAELTGQVSKLKARVGMRERQLESLARQAGIELPPEMRPQAASWSRGAAAAELPSSQQVLRNAQKLGKKKEKDDPNDPIYKTIRNVNPMRTQARAGLKSVKQAVADALPLSRDMVPKEEEYVIPSEPSQLPMTEIPLGAFAGAPTLSSLAASSGEGGL